MKKHTKPTRSAPTRRDIDPKPRAFRTITDGAGIRRPIMASMGADGEPVEPLGDHPRPAPTSSIKCGECRHAEECGAMKICRSFLSPRAGFAHVAKHACGYGRKHEAAA